MDAGRRPAGRHAERQEQRAGNDAIGHAKGAVDHLGAETDENERQDFAEMGDKDVDHSLVPAMIVYRLDWYITGRQETFCFIGRSRNSPPSGKFILLRLCTVWSVSSGAPHAAQSHRLSDRKSTRLNSSH